MLSWQTQVENITFMSKHDETDMNFHFLQNFKIYVKSSIIKSIWAYLYNSDLSIQIEIWYTNRYKITFFMKYHESNFYLKIKILKINYCNSFKKDFRKALRAPPAVTWLTVYRRLTVGGSAGLIFLVSASFFEVCWAGVCVWNWLKLSGTPGKNISCSFGSVISLRKSVNILNSTKKYQLYQ